MGTVQDKQTQQPVAQALVVAVEVENEQPTENMCYQTTLSNGYYIIDGIKQGKEYWLFVCPPKESNYALDLTPRKITVRAGQQFVQDTDFELEVGGSIEGTVTEKETDQPLNNVEVIAKSEDGIGKEITNEKGEYRISNLRPGSKYSVFLLRKGYIVESVDNIGVLAKETTYNVNFVSKMNVEVSINGVARDSLTGKPIENVFVAVMGENGGGWDITQSSGNYQIKGLSLGLYTVVTMIYGYEGYKKEIEIDLGDIKILNFDLKSSVNGDKLLLKKKSNDSYIGFRKNNFFSSIAYADTCVTLCKDISTVICAVPSFFVCCKAGIICKIAAPICCVIFWYGCGLVCSTVVQRVCVKYCCNRPPKK